MKPELAVYERQIAQVFPVLESRLFLIIVGFCMFIPEDVEGVKERLGTPEQEVAKLRLAISIETDDLAIEHASATVQIASKSLAECIETNSFK